MWSSFTERINSNGAKLSDSDSKKGIRPISNFDASMCDCKSFDLDLEVFNEKKSKKEAGIKIHFTSSKNYTSFKGKYKNLGHKSVKRK